MGRPKSFQIFPNPFRILLKLMNKKFLKSENYKKGEKNMFLPREVFFEKNAQNYELGKELLTRYQEKGIPCIEIENHNNIEEMRKKENKEFPKMKQNLIIGIRKTHKFVPNHKTSDYLVPYTSSRLHCHVLILLFSL